MPRPRNADTATAQAALHRWGESILRELEQASVFYRSIDWRVPPSPAKRHGSKIPLGVDMRWRADATSGAINDFVAALDEPDALLLWHQYVKPLDEVRKVPPSTRYRRLAAIERRLQAQLFG